MAAPICLKCGREAKIKATGAMLFFYNSIGEIYRAQSFDLFSCPECGNELSGGMATGSMYRNEVDLDEMLARMKSHNLAYEVK